jgi:hypothetical protein
VAACKIDADEYFKKPITEQKAQAMMERAKQWMVGPETPTELCSTLSLTEIQAIRSHLDNDTERNGPLVYTKLVRFFVNGYDEFKGVHDQWTTAKNALEKAWCYRMHVLFMTPEATLTRDGIRDALDQRERALDRDNAKRTRQNDIQQAMNNPEVIAAMLQNPQMRAMFMQIMDNRVEDDINEMDDI